MAITCTSCGAKPGMMALMAADLGGGEYVCEPCKAKAERQARMKAEAIRETAAKVAEAIREAAAKVIVTTTPSVDGTRVVAYLGIESVEYVIGTGPVAEFTTGIADIFGARSTAFEKKLQAAKVQAMDALKIRAAEKGANAVIGVDLDFTEFSGNRVALVLNGTLVKLAVLKPQPVAKQPDPEV